jgi:hypothetical protein
VLHLPELTTSIHVCGDDMNCALKADFGALPGGREKLVQVSARCGMSLPARSSRTN